VRGRGFAPTHTREGRLSFAPVFYFLLAVVGHANAPVVLFKFMGLFAARLRTRRIIRTLPGETFPRSPAPILDTNWRTFDGSWVILRMESRIVDSRHSHFITTVTLRYEKSPFPPALLELEYERKIWTSNQHLRTNLLPFHLYSFSQLSSIEAYALLFTRYSMRLHSLRLHLLLLLLLLPSQTPLTYIYAAHFISIL
jgi:hypothetical protein